MPDEKRETMALKLHMHPHPDRPAGEHWVRVGTMRLPNVYSAASLPFRYADGGLASMQAKCAAWARCHNGLGEVPELALSADDWEGLKDG
jgi:hypothetical protein